MFIEPLIRWMHVGGRGYKHSCTTEEKAKLKYAPSLNWKHQMEALVKEVTEKGNALLHSMASPLQRLCGSSASPA